MWEWLTDNAWLFWLVAVIVLAAVEMLTLDFLFLMMSAAALLAFGLSWITDNFVIQVVAFAVTSVLLIFLVRPVALRRLNRSTPETVSNVARLVGLPCQVLDPVTARSGLVRLEGDTWSARSLTGESLPTGTDVYVHRVEGATVVVAPHPAPATEGRGAPRPSF
ncbi:membrane protein [Kocuria dechangensis]|uniref:Membrane protein n=1 Tax=Kocuria dechangensis TaxID=1176249 RepID=A0A917H6M7_9MICC|nr:NfeD family protein [Kocuria dechangensis]GGG68308.1 membrane protein [Kocuria dechangensis]